MVIVEPSLHSKSAVKFSSEPSRQCCNPSETSESHSHSSGSPVTQSHAEVSICSYCGSSSLSEQSSLPSLTDEKAMSVPSSHSNMLFPGEIGVPSNSRINGGVASASSMFIEVTNPPVPAVYVSGPSSAGKIVNDSMVISGVIMTVNVS